MNLDQLSIQARQRNPWEAIDLGIMLARQWYKPLFVGWMIPSLVTFIVLLLLFPNSAWISLTVTWWLKPLWDRIPLLVASRALFSEKTNTKDITKSLPKLLMKDWFAWLTWRRLSPTRSFNMPVTVLESLTGDARGKRLSVLQLNTGGAATWLTIVCVHIEAALFLGGLGTLYWLVPEETDFDMFGFIASDSNAAELLSLTLSYIAMVIVAPFYTVAGFTLYISRRIMLEGWDIEIRFRHLADRVKKTTPGGISTSLCILVVMMTMLITPGPSMAEASASEKSASETTEEPTQEITPALTTEAVAAISEIEQVLSGDDFGRTVTEKGWRFKGFEDLEKDESIPDWMITFIEYLEEKFADDDEIEESGGRIQALFANILEVMIWILAITLTAMLIYHYRKNIQELAAMAMKRKSPASVPDAPEVLFGLDVRQESLPENIPQKVMDLWQSGSSREALGLLYRATLSKLIHHHDFRFRESSTESECAALVKRSAGPELNEYMQSLTTTWQLLAYGHQAPDDGVVTNLCGEWAGVIER